MSVLSAPLILFVALARVGGGSKGDLEKMDAACSAAARVTPASKDGGLHIFAETSGIVRPKPREGEWRELGNEAELNALSEGATPPNTEATVRTTRAATLVQMYFQDKTGAWAHVVDYCYRPSGTLARLKGTFNSFTAAVAGHEGVRRRRTIYFDDDGIAVKTESHAFDIDDDRPLGDVTFDDVADPIYPATRALPFWASLAPAPVATKGDTDDVASTVREHLPAIKSCYEHALKKTPNVAGKVVARWKIDDAGRVRAFAWQSDQMHSAAFNVCAKGVVEHLTFAPAKGEPVTVSFPFVFETADAKVTLSPPASDDKTASR